MKKYPTKEEIEKYLSYDPETGIFTRHKTDRRGSKDGQAGHLKSNGYKTISIHNVHYYAHRLAWIVSYNEEPPMMIDHINRNRSDNRISNLRSVTNKENCMNKSIRCDNEIGITGVYWHKKAGKWMVERGRVYLGLYESLLEAVVCSINYDRNKQKFI